MPAQPLATTSTVVTVRAVHASVQLLAPAKVDPGEAFPFTLTPTADAGVPLTAVVDMLPLHRGAQCAATPSGEPTSASTLLHAGFTDTQQPAGTVPQIGTGQPVSLGPWLVCGWLEAGWTSSQNPPVVAGPASATVTVVHDRVFRGRTSQHHTIAITIAPIENILTKLTYADNLHCGGHPQLATGQPWNGEWSDMFTTQNFGTIHLGRTGALSLSLSAANRAFKLHARLAGNHLKGSFTEQGLAIAFTGVSGELQRCGTGTVRFSTKG
jgi:hypothetical protein